MDWHTIAVDNMKFYVVLILSFNGLYAQGRFVSKGDGQPAIETKFSGVEGTPYWDDNFVKAETKSRQNGKWYQYPKARFDCYKHELEYEQSPAKLLRLGASQINEFKLDEVIFRCGFPAAAEWDSRHFYQVLYDGNVKLLKKIHTKIVTETEFGAVVKASKFVREEHYYLLKNETMIRLKLKKSSILEALSDKEPQIVGFVKANNLGYSSENDLKRIVELYNQEQLK